MAINAHSYDAPDGKIFKKTVGYTDAISLNHVQKDLYFEFVALHYLRSEYNLYSWKLENYDTKWTPASKERQARYTNLAPGTYTFRVKGSNADGIWNEEGACIEISINPPWWATWWAYIGYFVIVAGGVFALYRFQLQRRLQMAEAVRLKELDAVKTRLYTNITHELRTPLTVILGMAQQVLESPKEHLKDGLAMIIKNGQNLLSLVNQMLDLRKLESGKLNLNYQQGDSIAYLKYIAESFHTLAENKSVQIHFLSDSEKVNMDFDEIRLQQIVSNLLSNAIKFTPKGGHIYISTRSTGNDLTIKIKDTGIGIAAVDLPHIFDRFYQSDSSHTRQGEGTGIGLALTRELVKLMEGTISVKSYKGKGAEFEVTLPIHHHSEFEEPAIEIPYLKANRNVETSVLIEQSTLPLLAIGDRRGVHGVQGAPLILIADDNEDVRSYIASCLVKEYAIQIAKNGEECDTIAKDVIPDLIVLDVMMPYKDGFEVCKLLKTDVRTSHIPIIMLTAKADMESRLEGLELGADDYLTKPFHKKELLTRIANLLSIRLQLQKYYRSSLEHGLSAVKKDRQEKHLASSNQVTPKSKLIADQGDSHNPSMPHHLSLENTFVIKAKNEIEAHLAEEEFNVEKLCRLLALSNSQVHRKLSALTGLSATHFIRYVRLIKAKEMMVDSKFKIAAIALDCGFNDPAYFSRVFKKEFGITPQQW